MICNNLFCRIVAISMLSLLFFGETSFADGGSGAACSPASFVQGGTLSELEKRNLVEFRGNARNFYEERLIDGGVSSSGVSEGGFNYLHTGDMNDLTMPNDYPNDGRSFKEIFKSLKKRYERRNGNIRVNVRYFRRTNTATRSDRLAIRPNLNRRVAAATDLVEPIVNSRPGSTFLLSNNKHTVLVVNDNSIIRVLDSSLQVSFTPEFVSIRNPVSKPAGGLEYIEHMLQPLYANKEADLIWVE